MPIPKKVITTWLAKQALWQVHISLHKKINHPHYKVIKLNEQRYSDLLYVPHFFEENTCKLILTYVDVTLRWKIVRALRTNKTSEVAFLLEAIYKRGGVFKYPKAYQCNKCDVTFKSDVTKCLKIHNIDIQRAAIKYKHTHIAFVKAFNKDSTK